VADTVAITAGSGTAIATDDISSVHYQRIKLIHGVDGTNDGDVSTANPLPIRKRFVTVTTTVTRPADTTAYAANDIWSDSTSAPTAGGFTFSSAARASGGSGLITDIGVINSAASALTGELWIFDSAVTAVNDNAAFALSDSDALLLVGIVPFLTEAQPSNAIAWLPNVNLGFTASGSANLRFLIKVKSAYTPISAETLTARLKILQID